MKKFGKGLLFKRDQDCGVIEIFENLPGIIIVSVLKKNLRTNKISFNGGFKWIKIQIEIGDHDICQKVHFLQIESLFYKIPAKMYFWKFFDKDL